MGVKIFWKESCPKCPKAKELGESLKKEGIHVNLFSLDEPGGLAEATFFSVMSTPTVIIEKEGKEVVSWRDRVPAVEEVKKFL